MNFFPDWYIKEKRKRYYNIFNIAIFIFIVLDIILFTRYFMIYKNVKNLENKAKEIILKENNTSNYSFKIERNDLTYKSTIILINLKKNFKNEINFKNIIVKGNIINFEASTYNKNNYFRFLKNIESDDNYKILELSLPNNNKDEYSFNISVEVKQYD